MPHINYALDKVSSVYCVHRKRVLLIFHKKLQVWLPPGGHVEPNETSAQAAHREFEEECGVPVFLTNLGPEVPYDGRARSLPLPFATDVHPITDTHSHEVNCYLGKLLFDHPAEPLLAWRIKPNYAEIEDACWFSLSALRDVNPTFESARLYAKLAIYLSVFPPHERKIAPVDEFEGWRELQPDDKLPDVIVADVLGSAI
jgi:8-oxo-dGTP pyrophosphatase MutT (NUDIX family)